MSGAFLYLFVRVVVGVDVVVKLLVSQVLLVTQLTVKKGLQIFYRASQSPLCAFLEEERKKRMSGWLELRMGKKSRLRHKKRHRGVRKAETQREK